MKESKIRDAIEQETMDLSDGYHSFAEDIEVQGEPIFITGYADIKSVQTVYDDSPPEFETYYDIQITAYEYDENEDVKNEAVYVYEFKK